LRGPTFLDGPEGGQVLPAVPQALPCGRGYAALEKHGTVESRMIATRPRRQRQSTGIRARCLGACGSPARRPVNIDFLAMSRPLSFYAANQLDGTSVHTQLRPQTAPTLRLCRQRPRKIDIVVKAVLLASGTIVLGQPSCARITEHERRLVFGAAAVALDKYLVSPVKRVILVLVVTSNTGVVPLATCPFDPAVPTIVVFAGPLASSRTRGHGRRS
jgi:hypothetical protein